VKINAITVPAGMGEELVKRFAARAGGVEQAPGFEAFRLLRPNDDRDVFLVYTQWATEEDFQTWRNSAQFAGAHAGQGAGPSGGHPGGGHPGGHPGGGPPGAGGSGGPSGGPVASASELWSFDVVQSA
jgi:heme-degrading monooxygenase HmoA